MEVKTWFEICIIISASFILAGVVGVIYLNFTEFTMEDWFNCFIVIGVYLSVFGIFFYIWKVY